MRDDTKKRLCSRLPSSRLTCVSSGKLGFLHSRSHSFDPFGLCYRSTTLTKRIEALETRTGFLATPILAIAFYSCEPQTYFRSRKKRERSDDWKYVCRSQANLVPESSHFFKMAADILENEKTLGARLTGITLEESEKKTISYWPIKSCSSHANFFAKHVDFIGDRSFVYTQISYDSCTT